MARLLDTAGRERPDLNDTAPADGRRIRSDGWAYGVVMQAMSDRFRWDPDATAWRPVTAEALTGQVPVR
ncbi:MAG: hypothetical protein KDB56_07385 [Mycobacterium sp.]|nr:hypothetical protein [Mycobacterium sp.]